MVATLQSRKEALEAKILEKNEELKRLCLQEADLTGTMPPEIPLEPGEPPPPIRRRVGTSFSFPQNLINNVKDADDESLTALELECRVQINIAEAALALANDSAANKAARRKHRLMYRQSQRKLMELETRLNLLKQSKTQVKKKPRPNTTAVENFFWKKNEQNSNYFEGDQLGSWPGKLKANYSLDESDDVNEFVRQNDLFGSLQRSSKSGTTAQTINNTRTDRSNDDFKMGTQQLVNSISYPLNLMSGPMSHPNVQLGECSKLNLNLNPHSQKRNGKKGIIRRQWDSQSAGGTLLPSQTYPEPSHQPNLNRTQSLGNMESTTQKTKDSWSVQDLAYEASSVKEKEKEWYETSLDSAPSPPLRTTSRLPSMVRVLYQMQDLQSRESDVIKNTSTLNDIQLTLSHPALSTSHKSFAKSQTECNSADIGLGNLAIDTLSNSIQQVQLNPTKKTKSNMNSFRKDFEYLNKNDFVYNYGCFDENQQTNNSTIINMPKAQTESSLPCLEGSAKLDLAYPSTSSDPRFFQTNESNVGLIPTKQTALNQVRFKAAVPTPEKTTKGLEIIANAVSNGLYMNIPIDITDGTVSNWVNEEQLPNQIKSGQIAVPQESVPKVQPTTQPYYHTTKHSSGEKIKTLQYQAVKKRQASVSQDHINETPPSPVQSGTHHPPQAAVQNEISFDTVVPFESPQNHTVVQAGKWQPYREVTKPFEMSDFYKYSTKFRQNQSHTKQCVTPDGISNSPSTIHQKGIYTPLKPMTCRPVESKSNQGLIGNDSDQNKEPEKTLVEVSPPEIV
ncbi:hypothetical protein RUM43_010702 [Polyplax serrata]|uniref:Cytohesin Ubiquitin Protein Inducing domain-containing protein n=1 Tax=Polyplax serrata TaxID=468196 RepID=A0AAN8P4L3_POLSC